MARPGRQRTGNTENKRAVRSSILDAATLALAEVGYAGTSAREIAERAGIATAGVFYHFGSMDETLAATLDHLAAQRLERLDSIFQRHGADWPAAVRELVESEPEHPAAQSLFELVAAARTVPALRDAASRTFDEATEFTRSRIAERLVGPGLEAVVPLSTVAQLVAASFFGLETLVQLNRPIDLDGLERLLRLIAQLTSVLDQSRPS